MDTSSFDKQAQSHLSFYHGFMNGVKIVVVLIILTLVGMAITLLRRVIDNKRAAGMPPLLLRCSRLLSRQFRFPKEEGNLDSRRLGRRAVNRIRFD